MELLPDAQIPEESWRSPPDKGGVCPSSLRRNRSPTIGDSLPTTGAAGGDTQGDTFVHPRELFPAGASSATAGPSSTTLTQAEGDHRASATAGASSGPSSSTSGPSSSTAGPSTAGASSSTSGVFELRTLGFEEKRRIFRFKGNEPKEDTDVELALALTIDGVANGQLVGRFYNPYLDLSWYVTAPLNSLVVQGVEPADELSAKLGDLVEQDVQLPESGPRSRSPRHRSGLGLRFSPGAAREPVVVDSSQESPHGLSCACMGCRRLGLPV